MLRELERGFPELPKGARKAALDAGALPGRGQGAGGAPRAEEREQAVLTGPRTGHEQKAFTWHQHLVTAEGMAVLDLSQPLPTVGSISHLMSFLIAEAGSGRPERGELQAGSPTESQAPQGPSPSALPPHETLTPLPSEVSEPGTEPPETAPLPPSREPCPGESGRTQMARGREGFRQAKRNAGIIVQSWE